ncbi:MAG: proteasome assembly chaperone family protein [Halodesulfurarchaeum sp.]
MADVVIEQTVDLDQPTLVEGLPGVGLVGKIATDHVVETFDMTRIGHIDCDGLPKIAIYGEESRDVHFPVRLYGDETRDLLALQSDVPVSRDLSPGFARTVTDWVADVGAVPLYLSGQPLDRERTADVPSIFGVATGDGTGVLEEHGIRTPRERGAIGGPTGALINRAAAEGIQSLGIVVESDPQFPDPAAARQLIVKAIEPIAEVSVETDELVEHAEEIRKQKAELAKRMGDAGEEESSQAKPLGMFQ